MRHVFLTTLFLAAIPVAVFAASGTGTTTGSGTTHTGSGAVTVEDTGALVLQNLHALSSSLQDHPIWEAVPMLPQSKTDGWLSDVDRYRQRSVALRAQCQDEIRRANRDTIMQKSLACLRGDLMQEMTFLRQEKAYILSLPGLTPAVESGATVNIDALTDAEMTVVNAIDSGLYTQIDPLKDVKQKLTMQYRTPAWLSMLQVKADRNLTWIHYVSERLNDILTDGTATPLLQSSALEAVRCLEGSRQSLQGVVSATDLDRAGSGYTAAQKSLTDCRSELWTVAHLKERQQEAQTGSGGTASLGK